MEIPSGMTENMMLIARIEAERRRAGAKSYGYQVNNNDYSHLSVAPLKHMLVCVKCGKEFSAPRKSRRKYCDECKVGSYRESKKNWWDKRRSKNVSSNT